MRGRHDEVSELNNCSANRSVWQGSTCVARHQLPSVQHVVEKGVGRAVKGRKREGK